MTGIVYSNQSIFRTMVIMEKAPVKSARETLLEMVQPCEPVLSSRTVLRQFISNYFDPHATTQKPVDVLRDMIHMATGEASLPSKKRLKLDHIKGDHNHLQPSTARALHDACNQPAVPVIITPPQELDLFTSVAEAYFNAVTINTRMSNSEPEFNYQGQLTVSLSDHEDIQYEYDRTSRSYASKRVPDCSLGARCHITYRNDNRGCLQQYLLPEQQRIFDEKGILPSEPGPCIECHRTQFTTFYNLYNSFNQSLDKDGIRQNPVLIPPYTNVCNIVGGYKEEHMILANQGLIACQIVRSSALIRLVFNQKKQRYCWDQSALKFTGMNPHFHSHNNHVQG